MSALLDMVQVAGLLVLSSAALFQRILLS